MATARFKYRLYPNADQRTSLAQTFGCARYAYNWALALRKEEPMSYHESSSRLTAHKKEVPWLNEVSCVPVQQSLRHLQTAFKNLKERRSGFPSFKRKHDRQSAEFTRSAFSLRDGRLFLGKVPGLVRIRWSRDLPSEPTTVTVERDTAGRYFASFVVAFNPKPLPLTAKAVGIDLGLNDIFVASDGFKSGNPRHLKHLEATLKRAQRSLSRKQKGGANRQKARVKVAKIHARIADARKDWLDKCSTELVRRYDRIVVEDLRVTNMVKNHTLAQAISDASWGQFVRMLQYKAAWYGKEVVLVAPQYTSRDCSDCGHRTGSLPLHIRRWECPACGSAHDRDVNAAINVLRRDTPCNASGSSGRPMSTTVGKAA